MIDVVVTTRRWKIDTLPYLSLKFETLFIPLFLEIDKNVIKGNRIQTQSCREKGSVRMMMHV